MIPARARRIADGMGLLVGEILAHIGINGDAVDAFDREWRKRGKPWLLAELAAGEAPLQTEPGAPYPQDGAPEGGEPR
jgi:hypothetical protein